MGFSVSYFSASFYQSSWFARWNHILQLHFSMSTSCPTKSNFWTGTVDFVCILGQVQGRFVAFRFRDLFFFLHCLFPFGFGAAFFVSLIYLQTTCSATASLFPNPYVFYYLVVSYVFSPFVSARLAYKPSAESTAGWFGVRGKHYWLADKPSQIQTVTGCRTGWLLTQFLLLNWHAFYSLQGVSFQRSRLWDSKVQFPRSQSTASFTSNLSDREPKL